MEEILASIRRIISEDDAPEGEEGAAPAAEMPELEPMATATPPSPSSSPEDDVLELTDRVGSDEPHTLGDLEIQTRHDVEPEPAPLPLPMLEPEPLAAYSPTPQPAPLRDDEHLVGDPASEAAALAFGKLSATIAMPAAGRTLEDVVREMLRPLLKAWLDENLPGIVQATVDQEVERIARSRVR